MFDFTDPKFTDEDKAREYLESVRWPNGPTCPHCGEVENVHRLDDGAHRKGLLYCRSCRGQFSVTVGTAFERSHVPLTKWVMATFLLCSSKKGISSHQLSRMLGVTYKTAWFMSHRIREGMTPAKGEPPMGGEGRAVEADETYLGNKRGVKKARPGSMDKRAVLALVERHGKIRMFHIDRADIKTIRPIVEANVARETVLHTDESPIYPKVAETLAGHETVNHHRKEYARGKVTTNTAEGAFSVFKRGMKGVYQQCAEHHLHRYVTEFEFRYNNRSRLGIEDAQRTVNALKGIEGKRLTYRRTCEASA